MDEHGGHHDAEWLAAALARNPFTLVPHSREKFEYLAAFDIQRWYHQPDGPLASSPRHLPDELAELGLTMRTRYLPLSIDVARALDAEYQRRRVRDTDAEEEEDEPRASDDLVAHLANQVQHTIDRDFGGIIPGRPDNALTDRSLPCMSPVLPQARQCLCVYPRRVPRYHW